MRNTKRSAMQWFTGGIPMVLLGVVLLLTTDSNWGEALVGSGVGLVVVGFFVLRGWAWR